MNIADLLLQKGMVRPDQVAEASRLAQRDNVRLDRALVKLGYVDEEALLGLLSERMGIPLIDLASVTFDREVLRALPHKFVFRKQLVPVKRHDGTLTVATSDPFDLYALDEVRLLTGLEVEPALATEEEIGKFIKAHYGVGGDTLDQMSAPGVPGSDALATGVEGGDADTDDLLEMAQEASVVKLVNEIFIEAINERASDIHIEPYEKHLSVRYRIDGVLHNTSIPAQIRRFQAAIISRIKIMANLNIAEKRLPQDGRIKLNLGGKQIDLRVSVIPMLFGEGMVMRILDRSSVLLTLPQLGMAQDTFAVFEQIIDRPHGILLVTGPTGSGKTTTLYAALQAIVGPEIKVLTVEDPVEYQLDGVNQIQVQPKIGFTFSAGLRAILRHDPDVVMIGEIRDFETAEAAIQASLTGHLVLSTLHTNDSSSAATRLIDMGIEPFLVASTLEAAMAQRLIRLVCPDCREDYEPDAALLPPDFRYQAGERLFRGAGCKKCRGTGYRGRGGVYELLVANEPIREKIMARAPASQIIKVAQETAGLRLLREDGWLKVRRGETTVEEVIRSTKV